MGREVGGEGEGDEERGNRDRGGNERGWDKKRDGEEERREGVREGGGESILVSTSNNTVVAQPDMTGFTFHTHSLSCIEMVLLLLQTTC